MVCADHDWVISTKEVWAATFESINDSCHFFIMDVVILFCREESTRVESNWVLSIREFLADNDAQSKV